MILLPFFRQYRSAATGGLFARDTALRALEIGAECLLMGKKKYDGVYTADPETDPTATMIDIGVAKPSAHGQAMMTTETAAISPKASGGTGPQTAHAMKAATAMPRTAGTK